MNPKLLDQSLAVTPRQFGAFRIALGTYLAVHFAQLLPYADELFGGAGILGDPDLNLIPKLLPNPLWDGPTWAPSAAIVVGLLASVGIAMGWARALCCALAWLVWAWLFARNNLILNPGLPYVGLLILLTATVPRGEALVPRRRPDPDWRFPAMAWYTAWILLAVGYSFSGLMKLGSPSWIDGSALRDVLQNPLARPGWPRELFLQLPDAVTNLSTWGVLALEILFVPLALFRRTRCAVWAAMAAMHIGIMVLIDFADLSLGMLLAHLFVWDPRWRLGSVTGRSESASRSAAAGETPARPSGRGCSPAAP